MLKFYFFLAFFWKINSYGQTVDTITIYSVAMKTASKCIVIKPAGYKKKNNFYPAIYLLHGYDGRYDNWITKMLSLKYYASFFNTLIICPDGGFSSWYINSPLDNSQYETYMLEVVKYIDMNYKTIKDRNHRAITGLSMGGYGAFMLAIKHSEIFGAAGSMSGAMDLKEIATKYDLMKRLGDTIHYAEQWKKYSVLNITDTFKSRLKLLFDCGTRDGFINGNRALHIKLMKRSVAHDYIERDGGHSWNYWINALPYHLLFFRKYFDEPGL
ncbi:MAG TPA: alpha/beta hydrolase family protein [Ferruginibacter sp.]|nr:alpha/beta hydrolase family protein [Ferruginibacter sp.]